MIGRVTQNYTVNDFNSNLRNRQSEMQEVSTSLTSGYRVNLPSQDPVATINYMEFDSRLKEIDTYKGIINNNIAKLNVVEGSLDNATSILQRMRELAIQAANGIYTAEERQKIAVEVDQLTRELITNGNADYKGVYFFGGTNTDESPFKVSYERDPESGMEFVKDVRYIGNSQSQVVEVERNDRVTTVPSGNQVFWAENMSIYSTLNVGNYTAPNDSAIMVDGIKIEIKTGDNLDIIAKKINESGAAVRAGVTNNGAQSYFSIDSTSPHQISLLDMEGGTVLQDLGIIDGGMQSPNNYSPSARLWTGSIFDIMVHFRKSLMSDDIFKIGGRAIAGIDNSLSNMLTQRAHLGAVTERLDMLTKRFLSDEVFITDAKENAIGTDLPKAITKLKMLEFAHDVALNVGSRIVPKTLLDFMR